MTGTPKKPKAAKGHVGNVDPEKLKAYLTRMDVEADARDRHTKSIGSIVNEAKGHGFDGKALRKVHVRRRMEPETREREDESIHLYEHALGAKGLAMAAVRDGATWEEAAAAHNVPRATLARAIAVSNRPETIPDHDAETGELPRDMVAEDLGEWVPPKPKRERKPEIDFSIKVAEIIQRLGIKVPEPSGPIITDAEVTAGLEATMARLAELRQAHA